MICTNGLLQFKLTHKNKPPIARNEAIAAHANQRNLIIRGKRHFNCICLFDWDSSAFASFFAMTGGEFLLLL